MYKLKTTINNRNIPYNNIVKRSDRYRMKWSKSS